MVLDATIRRELDRAVLCWVATVGADALPNVSPKEIFLAGEGDRLLIADIASPTTVRNVVVNPQVCVSFIDVFLQRGFKLIGEARTVGPRDDEFERWAAPLRRKAGPHFRIRGVILVDVHRAHRIWAPSYALFPERSDDERRAEAYRTYGVRAAAREEARHDEDRVA